MREREGAEHGVKKEEKKQKKEKETSGVQGRGTRKRLLEHSKVKESSFMGKIDLFSRKRDLAREGAEQGVRQLEHSHLLLLLLQVVTR